MYHQGAYTARMIALLIVRKLNFYGHNMARLVLFRELLESSIVPRWTNSPISS